jgi:long-chain acyl-CoA synthetase
VRDRYDVSSMRLVTHTGASCPIDVKRKMIDWFGPVLQDAYGATEVGTTCTISSAEWLEHPGSVGRAVPPFRAIVVGEDGEEVPPGTEGRLYFEDATGRGIVYPDDPEKTARAHLRPGVFTLGEIGYVTDDGFVYITDRFSDMIVSGGVNIYPAEAEQVLIGHSQVADVAVIGVPSVAMGEEVKALVVATEVDAPPSADELIAWCRERLAGYKCPRSIDFVTTVGRTAMGKVNKRDLRRPFWEAAATTSRSAPG